MIIVGAGLSGVGMAARYGEKFPEKRYAILEARGAIGGTWDLFRYPGVRSDSDMHTLGYDFKPWTGAKAIADGASILRYIRECAHERGIDRFIRYHHRVRAARWSSQKARWTLTIDHKDSATPTIMSCNFLALCAGYYNYQQGHTPEFSGRGQFTGPIIHPQHWPDNIDYRDKHIVVIGSGATAITLVPELARHAAHVTMVQRSPSYVTPLASTDLIANILRKILPEKLAYKITRWKNITRYKLLYAWTRAHPDKARKTLLGIIRKRLGPDYDIERHFTPAYNPWDQRLCIAADGDIFDALKAGRASIVTDHIDRFTKTGIALKSGQHLDADMIITATGLDVVMLGGCSFCVDGTDIHLPDSFGYKGMMFSGVPNLVSVFGYTNASWTLRADLVAQYVCRLSQHMDQTGMRQVMACPPADMVPAPWFDFQPGYIQRALQTMPKQGDRDPWRNRQDYPHDKKALTRAAIDDDYLQFTNPAL